jgi:glucose/arabinose dehydrogenase
MRSMSCRTTPLYTLVAALALTAAAACGSDDDSPTGTDGVATRVDVIAGDSQTATVGAALPTSIIVRVSDASGRPVSDQRVELRVSGQGSISPATALTNAAGLVVATWTLDTLAGENILTATVEGLTPARASARGSAGPAARITARGSTIRTGVAGRALADSLGVLVTDRYGNPVAGVSVGWEVTAGGGVLSPATTVTDSGGRAAAQWTLGAEGENVARASADGAPPVAFIATATSSLGTLTLAVEVVASGLFNPLLLVSPPGDARRFVVEQPGRVRVIENGQLLATPFLDITSKVKSGDEQGLLGMAFHPRYAENGFVYVSYTDLQGDSRIERYRVSATDRNRADPASASLVLFKDQPMVNHNGGMIAFGADGMLYIAFGDGGGGGDPLLAGQDLGTLLGKLLRLDVDAAAPYAVPPTNPFTGRPGARPEIWALGLRNPWRFAFDTLTGLLYLADVGQNLYEEVNVVPAAHGGLNYGWSIMEGLHCFRTPECSSAGLVLPVVEYDHSQGCSVTGGFVYRGQQIPELAGHYFYSDYCAGFLRSFRFADGRLTEARSWSVPSPGNVLSFGQDSAGELYMLAGDGRVLKIVRGS